MTVTARTEFEENWVDLEPAGVFPVDQDTNWGAMRQTFCEYLQILPDALDRWWLGMDMLHIDTSIDTADLQNWEEELGIPVNPAWDINLRKALLLVRRYKGPFTRTLRLSIIELFLLAFLASGGGGTLPPIDFGTTGMPFDPSGTDFGVDLPISLAGSYAVNENIPAFSYQVRILNTYYINGFDDSSLQAELERITPAPITFTMLSTATP